MQRFLEHCTAVLGRVIFIGFGIQIVLGILWMCNAFARWDSFGEGIVCVAETALLGAALAFVLQRGQGFVRGLFEVLCVLTFPMVLQCLMSPDVRVFAAALLLAQTGCILRAVKAAGRRDFLILFSSALCLWLAAGLLRGEYLFVGLVPMVLCLARLGAAERERMVRGGLLVMAVGGIIFGVGSLYQERESMLTHMASRVSWTTLYGSYTDLTEEQRENIRYRRLVESTYEVTGIEEILLPSLEESLGKQGAEKVLKELMAASWQGNKGRILKEIVWDMAGYTLTPLVLPLQLQGRAYESYSGLNYRQILLPAPRLGKLYMDYGCWWFAAALSLRCILWLASGRRGEWFGLFLKAAVVLFMAFLYTMDGAGRMDYKNTLYILCVWLMWIGAAPERGTAKKQAGRNRDEDA